MSETTTVLTKARIAKKKYTGQDRYDLIRKISADIAAKTGKDKFERTLQKAPSDSTTQEKLGELLLLWAKEDTATHLDDFPLSLGISAYDFHKLVHKNDYFAECYKQACSYIGSRIAKKVMDKMSGETGLKVLAFYSHQWREHLTSINKDSEQQPTRVTVITAAPERTALVDAHLERFKKDND